MTNKIKPPTPSLFEWLQTARVPYLSFLRNLTPQVFLGSMAWASFSKLDFYTLDFSNWGATALCYIFLVLFLYSVYSNISLFFADLFPERSAWLIQYEDSLKSSGITGLRVPMLLIKAVVKERPRDMIFACIAIVAVQFICAGMLVSSVVAAFKFLESMHQ